MDCCSGGFGGRWLRCCTGDLRIPALIQIYIWIECHLLHGLPRFLTPPFIWSDLQYVLITARLEKDSLISDGSGYTMIVTKVGVQAIRGSEVSAR